MLTSHLFIDPSQITEIKRKAPTKAFGRLASVLTRGLTSPNEERETFCALILLQEVNVVMRAVGIDDIVRLSKDGVAVYEDVQGRQGDLKEAMEAFAAKVSKESAQVFETLEIVLNHKAIDIDYRISINIKRIHPVGEYPISIVIDGVLTDNRASNDDKEIFASNEGLNAALFSNFVGRIEAAFKNHMEVDDLHRRDAVNSKSCKDLGGNAYYDSTYHHSGGTYDHQDGHGQNDDVREGHNDSSGIDNVAGIAPTHTGEVGSGGWLSSLTDSFGSFYRSAGETLGSIGESIGDSFGGDGGVGGDGGGDGGGGGGGGGGGCGGGGGGGCGGGCGGG